MLRNARLLLTLTAVLAAAVFAASPALASGGTPPPPPATSYCPEDGNAWFVTYPDGSTSFANGVSGAGCVFVRSYPAGYLRLDTVILAPGWTYVVKKNGEGTSSRVELQFTEIATDRKVDFRVEYGKTRIG